MQVQWSHTPVWASCARTIYDHKRGGKIHLPKPPPQINTVECYSSKPTETSAVCWCSGSERFSIEKLLRIHRWHRKTNIKTGWKPKNSVQWVQEAPCPKGSVHYADGWANCASFWTSWWVSLNFMKAIEKWKLKRNRSVTPRHGLPYLPPSSPHQKGYF